MKKIIKYGIIAFISFIILFLTLLIPQTVNNKTDMEAIKLGYPFHFVIQDVSGFDPPFPWKFNFQSPWEHSFSIVWSHLLLSYCIIFLSIILLIIGMKKLHRFKKC